MDPVVLQREPGMAQAWLMATVGPKVHKRQLRKSVVEVCIPRVCDALQSGGPMLLRVSSSILYGLSLLYKQKVGFMATDLSMVFDRICGHASGNLFLAPNALTLYEEQSSRKRASQLQDDPAFDLETDFVLTWKKEETADLVLNALLIQQVDQQLTQPAHPGENEPDNLVDGRAMANPSYAFDKNGNLLDTAGGQDQLLLDFLGDLNFDDDLNATAAVVEDLSETVNTISVSNDLTSATTLRLNEASVTQQIIPKPRKRQKLRIDTETTSNNTIRAVRRVTIRSSSESDGSSSSYSIGELIGSISGNQPQFVNLCYRLSLGSQLTQNIAFEALPLAQRHPDLSNIESFLKEIDEVERGRDAMTARPSLSFVEEILQRLDGDMDAELDLDLELSALNEESFESVEKDTDFASKLQSFEQFLRDKASTLSADAEPDDITFESLIPSLQNNFEEPVSQKLAAQSFAYLLELATRGIVTLKTPPNGDKSGNPADIKVSFL